MRGEGDLTKREREICALLGMSNKAIAKQLFRSELTIKTHVSNILKKLGVKSRTQAAVKVDRRAV